MGGGIGTRGLVTIIGLLIFQRIGKKCTSSFSIKKLHRVADLWPRHVKWGWHVKNAVHISNLYRPRFWQVDSPEVLLIDGPPLFSIWMASGPHVAMIFYPPFSTTHFFLLISLAYTYAYHRIVISQQRWDPEQHFDVKKQGWSFDKILSTRDSKYMQHFYWNGGSTWKQLNTAVILSRTNAKSTMSRARS